MKKTMILLFAGVMMFSFGCKKDDASTAQKDTLTTKYAKYRAAAYSDPLLKKWAATLEKGEPVGFLSEQKEKNGNAEITIAQVRLSDDKIVYMDPKSLAFRPIVFTGKDVCVYNRNNTASGVFATIPQGTVGFVTDEKADWSQIDIGKVGEKQVFGKWVKDGVSTDPDTIADAVSLEKIRSILSDSTKGEKDKEDAMKLLESIA
ncbi:MAG: hypothetical protein ACRCUT_07015, partial [Spirochaetota bacterium]